MKSQKQLMVSVLLGLLITALGHAQTGNGSLKVMAFDGANIWVANFNDGTVSKLP
jgi:hypothetical protein